MSSSDEIKLVLKKLKKQNIKIKELRERQQVINESIYKCAVYGFGSIGCLLIIEIATRIF